MNGIKAYDANLTHDTTSLLIKLVLGFFIWGFHGFMGHLPSWMWELQRMSMPMPPMTMGIMPFDKTTLVVVWALVRNCSQTRIPRSGAPCQSSGAWHLVAPWGKFWPSPCPCLCKLRWSWQMRISPPMCHVATPMGNYVFPTMWMIQSSSSWAFIPSLHLPCGTSTSKLKLIRDLFAIREKTLAMIER